MLRKLLKKEQLPGIRQYLPRIAAIIQGEDVSVAFMTIPNTSKIRLIVWPVVLPVIDSIIEKLGSYYINHKVSKNDVIRPDYVHCQINTHLCRYEGDIQYLDYIEDAYDLVLTFQEYWKNNPDPMLQPKHPSDTVKLKNPFKLTLQKIIKDILQINHTHVPVDWVFGRLVGNNQLLIYIWPNWPIDNMSDIVVAAQLCENYLKSELLFERKYAKYNLDVQHVYIRYIVIETTYQINNIAAIMPKMCSMASTIAQKYDAQMTYRSEHIICARV
jgi:hypothetical protein